MDQKIEKNTKSSLVFREILNFWFLTLKFQSQVYEGVPPRTLYTFGRLVLVVEYQKKKKNVEKFH